LTHTETMLHLVVYDIPSDKVRTRLHKALSRYGEWTQFSLFECYLSQKQTVQLLAEVKSLLGEEEGHVRIYVLSRDDVKRTITIGGKPPEEKRAYVV
jgi:CRISPR-associated protein Cas2